MFKLSDGRHVIVHAYSSDSIRNIVERFIQYHQVPKKEPDETKSRVTMTRLFLNEHMPKGHMCALTFKELATIKVEVPLG